jgi:large conductance mechanosensitive channel
MSNFIKEFKEFAVKGNAIDMAVGVIIGGAFGEIVNSIVNDIIMPPIGWLIGGVNFSDLKVELPKVVLDGGIELAPATINYGSFVQTIINFIIIALCVFMMIKGLAKLKNAKKAEEEKEEVPAAPAEPSNEEKLLTEIRDLLAKK